jgi:hypothetical protein
MPDSSFVDNILTNLSGATVLHIWHMEFKLYEVHLHGLYGCSVH